MFVKQEVPFTLILQTPKQVSCPSSCYFDTKTAAMIWDFSWLVLSLNSVDLWEGFYICVYVILNSRSGSPARSRSRTPVRRSRSPVRRSKSPVRRSRTPVRRDRYILYPCNFIRYLQLDFMPSWLTNLFICILFKSFTLCFQAEGSQCVQIPFSVSFSQPQKRQVHFCNFTPCLCM